MDRQSTNGIAASPEWLDSGRQDGSPDSAATSQGDRMISRFDLDRIRQLQGELSDAIRTSEVAQQIRNLQQDRYQLCLELLATKYQLDIGRQQIDLNTGRIVAK